MSIYVGNFAIQIRDSIFRSSIAPMVTSVYGRHIRGFSLPIRSNGILGRRLASSWYINEYQLWGCRNCLKLHVCIYTILYFTLC